MIRSITIFPSARTADCIQYALDPPVGTFVMPMTSAEVDGDEVVVYLPGSPAMRRTYRGLPYVVAEDAEVAGGLASGGAEASTTTEQLRGRVAKLQDVSERVLAALAALRRGGLLSIEVTSLESEVRALLETQRERPI